MKMKRLNLPVLFGFKRLEYLLLLLTLLDCLFVGDLLQNVNDGLLLDFQSEVAPTVFIVILVRNKAHTLPYFLTLLEKLDYPKERIAIWIRSDYNEDNSTEILRIWGKGMRNLEKYHSVSIEVGNPPPNRQTDQHPFKLTSGHIIKLKNEAIKVAQKIWADYIWFLDAGSFILNNQTLKQLVSKQKDLVAPLLLSSGSGLIGMYSNFWGYSEDYAYLRPDDYTDFLNGKKTGCFPVPLIHSGVLMNIRRKNFPDFSQLNETIPEDDIIRFAVSAQAKNMKLEICNDMEYGVIMSPLEEDTLYSENSDYQRFQNLHAEISTYWPDLVLPVSDLLKQFVPKLQQFPPSTLGLDKIYIINLKRRPDRLHKMDRVMKILGMDYTRIEAVDGRELTPESIDKMGIKIAENYRDPFQKRRMTFGEIGCFLSHYKAWERMVKYHITTALILEDDVRFEPNFVDLVQRVFAEAVSLKLDWDLIYVGRKSLNANVTDDRYLVQKRNISEAMEPFVKGSKYLVHVDFSYGGFGYALSLKGAKKLIAAKPLEKLVPVDELFPLMFDKHFIGSWNAAYPKRDLKAFSVEPLLLYPKLYKDEPGYFSDTEYSSLLPQEKENEI